MKQLFWIFQEARIHQYIKNFFIFVPAFFAQKALQTELWPELFTTAGLFCLLSSAVYMLNDCYDLQNDQQDSRRNRRPLAAGKLKFATVASLGGFLTVAALCGALFFSWFLFGIFIFYLGCNLIYTCFGKRHPPFDIFLVCLCFLCRIMAGTLSWTIPCSAWLIIIVTLLTLLLAVGKRMDYLPHPGYNRMYIVILMVILSTSFLLCYIIYLVNMDKSLPFYSDFSFLTIFPVLAGIMRYFQCVLVYRTVCCPTELLLKDRGLQLCVGIWLTATFCIIYCWK